MSLVSNVPWSLLIGMALTATPLTSSGRNSRIFRLDLKNGQTLIGKVYYRNAADPRDRLNAERIGLTLAREAGLEVPDIVATSHEHGALILEYVEGKPVHSPSSRDVDAAVNALQILEHVARTCDTLQPVGSASEACFSGPALAANLETRFTRLQHASGDEPEYASMARLLAQLRQESQRRLDTAAKILGNHWDARLDQRERSLSPSDFGFHNAIRRTNETLCFLDFEYFGWDDPAKTISDFVLHPAMKLPPALSARFIAATVQALDRGTLVPRLLAYYPLFTLKWCCIFLNEFVADDMARRHFAGREARRDVLRRQLEKARTYMENIDENYARFRASMA